MARIRTSRAPRRAPKPARYRFSIWLSNLVYVVILALLIGGIVLFWPKIRAMVDTPLGTDAPAIQSTAPALGTDAPAIQSTAPALGNVGGQAPPDVRGSNPERAIVATPIPGIAQSEAEAISLYQTAVAASGAPPSPIPQLPTPNPAAPLPLNSAGAPVIDRQQQQQLELSAQMAADEQQAALQAAQLADAESRAPDVSKEDAEQMLHRDLCSVPRANPHTCAQGLFKPTPIGAP
jgi:hypothetical protein